MEIVVKIVFWVVIILASVGILFVLARVLGESIAEGFIKGLEAKKFKGTLLLDADEYEKDF